jgi:hypothetical protein
MHLTCIGKRKRILKHFLPVQKKFIVLDRARDTMKIIVTDSSSEMNFSFLLKYFNMLSN